MNRQGAEAAMKIKNNNQPPRRGENDGLFAASSAVTLYCKMLFLLGFLP